MIFTDIKSFADDLIDTDDVKFPVARKVRFANRADERVLSIILGCDSRISFDSFNHSTAPMGTAALTSGIRSYKVRYDEYNNPILRLTKVMVEDENGTYQDVELVDIRSDDAEEIRLGTGGTGTPTRYIQLGQNIIFNKTPGYTSATGQRYIFQRAMDEFVVADTTKEPGFAQQFHILVPLWMAYWEGLKRGKEQVKAIRQEIQLVEAELQDFYMNLDVADELVMSTNVEDPR